MVSALEFGWKPTKGRQNGACSKGNSHPLGYTYYGYFTVFRTCIYTTWKRIDGGSLPMYGGKSWLLTNRHLLGVAIAIYFHRSVNLHVASSATKKWVLAFPLSFPSTKVHISHEETSSRDATGILYTFWGRIAQVSLRFCKKLTSVKVCYELWTIFCALHILIKSECGCKSSRQSEVTQSGFNL